MDLKRVGVVIPAYNAAKTLDILVKQLMALGFDEKHVVIVNDGSNDNTGQVATDLGVSVIDHEKNMGKGAALQTGFDFARKMNLERVFTLDADGQHKVADIKGFLDLTEDFDLLIGTRNHVANMPLLRKLTNRTTSLVVSLLSDKYIPDTQSGFRYLQLRIFEKIRLKARNFQTESELVVKAARNKYRIGFVPITTLYRDEKSHINPLVDTVRFVNMALRFLWR